MDSKAALSAFKITEEMHQDLNEIYEAVVDEDAKAPSMIDALVAKLKVLKSNINKTDEV